MALHQRLTARDAALLVVDVQEKVLATIPSRELVIANSVRLVKAAQILHIPYFATEQYPKGLGSTVPELATLIPHRPAKQTFHCCSVGEIVEQLHGLGVRHVTLAGIEAHVCVAQTAIELMNLGFRVQVAADAVASRSNIDWDIALRRIAQAGAVLSTTEAVLFEWTETSDRPQFKAISTLVKEFVTPATIP